MNCVVHKDPFISKHILSLVASSRCRLFNSLISKCRKSTCKTGILNPGEEVVIIDRQKWIDNSTLTPLISVHPKYMLKIFLKLYSYEKFICITLFYETTYIEKKLLIIIFFTFLFFGEKNYPFFTSFYF